MELVIAQCVEARGGGANFLVESDHEIKFTGEENLSLYSSSDSAERGFCKKCGSNLFYRLKDQSLSLYNFNLGPIKND